MIITTVMFFVIVIAAYNFLKSFSDYFRKDE
jgi:hypothetical protein